MSHIVAVVDATQRIPHELVPHDVTFFSDLDQWSYVALTEACESCLEYESGTIYPGSSLRSLFPYLEVIDIDTIAVNVHPNCQCYLERIVDVF